MAYFRRRLTYDEIAPFIQKFLSTLRKNTPAAISLLDPEAEAYFVDNTVFESYIQTLRDQFTSLLAMGFVQSIPYDDNHFLIIIDPKAAGPIQTISPTHIRLIKLSYLICLTPEDFFAFFRLLSTAKNTSAKDSLSLNPAGAGIESLESHFLSEFFTKLRTNYRINVDYADRKWTPRALISTIAALPTTRDSQLSAMQAITFEQNTDSYGIPVESAIDLSVPFTETYLQYCDLKRIDKITPLTQTTGPWLRLPTQVRDSM